MAKTVKYIRQDATGRGQALDDSSTFTIDAPKYIYSSFMPVWKVPNKKNASSKVAQRADTSDQVSDRTVYASDSNMSAESMRYSDIESSRDRVNQRKQARGTALQGNFIPDDFSELRNSHERHDSRFGASSGSVRASYHDMEGNPSVGNAFLDLLKAIGRITKSLLLRESRYSNMEGELVISPGYGRRDRERIELTRAEEREAVRRARDHWICHECKTSGLTTVNLEGRRLCRRIACRHDHTGCEDCPSRGNNMYEELLEHFKDEIRNEPRERNPRR